MNYTVLYCKRFIILFTQKIHKKKNKTEQINKGQRVTQFLLLPYYQTGKNLTSQARGHKAFGSSDLAFWVQEITAPRPLKDLLIQGNKMSRLSYEQLFRLFDI